MRPCIFHSSWKQHSPEICLTCKLQILTRKIDQWGFSHTSQIENWDQSWKNSYPATVLWPENLFAFGHRLKKELEKYKDDSWESVCETLQTEIEILQMVCNFHDVF